MLQFLFSCKSSFTGNLLCSIYKLIEMLVYVIKTGNTFEKFYILASCRAVFLV